MTTEPTPSRALRFLLSLRQQDWLALMLLALHAALVFGIDTALSKAFLLSHFGCFLLWQPVLRGEQKLYVGQALLIVGAAAVLVAARELVVHGLMDLRVVRADRRRGAGDPQRRPASGLAAGCDLSAGDSAHLGRPASVRERRVQPAVRGGGALRAAGPARHDLPGDHRARPARSQLQRRSDLQRPAVSHGRRARARRVRHPPVQPRQLRPRAGRGAAGDRRDPARPELVVGSARRLRRHRPGHEPLLHERGDALRALDAQPRQPRRSGARSRQVRHDRRGRHGGFAMGQRHRLADRDPARHVGPHHAPCHRMPPGCRCA